MSHKDYFGLMLPTNVYMVLKKKQTKLYWETGDDIVNVNGLVSRDFYREIIIM